MSFEVYRDAYGIPHLRASSALDLAFAQGHNAAGDRAWQIEVERHRSQGTTASFLGADAVAWDRFARQARLEDTARRCFHNLDAETGAWVAAYVDGVNAGLEAGARRAPQFADVGVGPGRWRPWTPLAIWISHHVLFSGLPAKLWREQTARRLGPDAVDLFATDGVGTSGSNGWLTAGGRTATGSALIAGDPHRVLEDPGIYQQIRLACDEFDVVGFAVPGVPGIAHFGHAGTVAWAITNAMADYQDLYQERLRRRGDQVEALGPDGWRVADRRVESILVGAGPGGVGGGVGGGEVRTVDVEIIETERGPVVIGGPDDSEAVSLRQPARVRADLGFSALPALLRAVSVADVDRALDRWAEPVNVVLAADTAGGLLHRVAGAVPIRDPAAVLRIVPAWEPGHEWQGWHDPMPHAPIEETGVAVMANERGLAAPFGVEFAPPHRASRIGELLRASTDWSAGEMAAIHMDTRLPSTLPLLDLIGSLDPSSLSPQARLLQERLARWDRRMDADSTDASRYAAVRSATVRLFAAHRALAELAGPSPFPDVFAPWLALPARIAFALDTLLTDPRLPAVDRPGLVGTALEDVAATPDPTAWGEVHRLAPWSTGPVVAVTTETWPGVAGDHDCVLATSSIPGVTDQCARGPAARYVWNLADHEQSLWVVPLGASGIPGDDHHRDQLPLWLRGDLIPVTTDWRRLTKENPHDL